MQSFASDHRYAQTNHVCGPLRKIRAQGPMYSDFFVRVDGRSQTIVPICGCEKCPKVTNSRLAHFATDLNVSR